MYGAIGQIILVTVVAALLAAGITLPAVAIIGIATRDVANTFDNLPVGTLGDPPAVSTVYASTGQVIASFYPGDIYRVPVSYDQIDPVMRNAIVSIEDSTFWQQGALDPRGTARALFSNSSGGQLQGASTARKSEVGASPQQVTLPLLPRWRSAASDSGMNKPSVLRSSGRKLVDTPALSE